MIVFLGALLIGLTLGLLGSGGSTITVPVLHYLVGHGARESIAETMAIVGAISAVTAVPYGRARCVEWHSVWNFGIPSMAGAWAGATLGGISHESIQLIAFGVIMLAASVFMLRGTRDAGPRPPRRHVRTILLIMIQGLAVGVIIGFVGVGGGFLIVPALVLITRLSIRNAIGTSLVIIFMNSTAGFLKYWSVLREQALSIDWKTILLFTAIGILGSFVGRRLNARFNQATLRRIFGLLLLLLGFFVIVRETADVLAGDGGGSPREIHTRHAGPVPPDRR